MKEEITPEILFERWREVISGENPPTYTNREGKVRPCCDEVKEDFSNFFYEGPSEKFIEHFQKEGITIEHVVGGCFNEGGYIYSVLIINGKPWLTEGQYDSWGDHEFFKKWYEAEPHTVVEYRRIKK